jgi:hypothetical protein
MRQQILFADIQIVISLHRIFRPAENRSSFRSSSRLKIAQRIEKRPTDLSLNPLVAFQSVGEEIFNPATAGLFLL